MNFPFFFCSDLCFELVTGTNDSVRHGVLPFIRTLRNTLYHLYVSLRYVPTCVFNLFKYRKAVILLKDGVFYESKKVIYDFLNGSYVYICQSNVVYMEMRIIVNDNYGNLWYYCRLNIFIIHVASRLRIICETWNEGKIYVRN